MNLLPTILVIVSAVSVFLGIIFKIGNLEIFGFINSGNFKDLTYSSIAFAIVLCLMQIRDKIKS